MHATHSQAARIGSTLVVALFISAACGSAAPTTPAATAAVATSTATAAPTAPAAHVTPVPSPQASARLPAFAAHEPLVLFALRTDLGGGIFVMRPDGTGRTQLATDVLPGVHKRPDWSPDGTKVVFIDETTGRMWIAHLDGSPTEAVATCDVPGCDYPRWSPDGKRIAYSRAEGQPDAPPTAVGIEVIDLGSGTVTKVVRLERPLLADVPAWSPDGREIAFEVDRMDADANETGAAIAVVTAAGGDVRYLTRFESFAGVPDWGWTTNEILYDISLSGFQRTPPADSVSWDLFGIKPDGTEARRITSLQGGARLLAPHWTPDGRSIIAKQYDHNAGGGRKVDPVTGVVSAYLTSLDEARPLLRPIALAG
jgi:Tol biopolymer transport system component